MAPCRLPAQAHLSGRLKLAAASPAPQRERADLEHAVHAARVAFHQTPSSIAAATAFHQAVQALQRYDEARTVSQGSTLDALLGAYGEQSTMLFHRLGREPKDSQPIRYVRAPAVGPSADLSPIAGMHQAGDWLADFFDGSVATGLFHPATVDVGAQDLLLQILDARLDGPAQAACMGPLADGSLT
jgi:hypothetical protein